MPFLFQSSVRMFLPIRGFDFIRQIRGGGFLFSRSLTGYQYNLAQLKPDHCLFSRYAFKLDFPIFAFQGQHPIKVNARYENISDACSLSLLMCFNALNNQI